MEPETLATATRYTVTMAHLDAVLKSLEAIDD